MPATATISLPEPTVGEGIPASDVVSSQCLEETTAGRARDRYWPLDDARLRWYAYARVAWWHLLAGLGLRAGDNILMPDLICDVMSEPLRRLGLHARYYVSEPLQPITPTDLRPHVDDRTRAVLAVHYFGLPKDLRSVAAYCREMGVPLVEDASQAMLSQDEQRPIGRYGAATLFSFRKTLKLPHGAGLICNDVALDHRLAETPAHLAAPRRDVWRYWVKRVDRRWFGGCCERLLDGIRARRSGGSHDRLSDEPSLVDPFDPCLVRPGRSARWLALHWDICKEIHRRRELFARLAQRWHDEGLPGRPLLTTLPPGWVPYAFALEPDAMDAERTSRDLQALGLPAEPWPRLPDDVSVHVTDRRKVLILL